MQHHKVAEGLRHLLKGDVGSSLIALGGQFLRGGLVLLCRLLHELFHQWSDILGHALGQRSNAARLGRVGLRVRHMAGVLSVVGLHGVPAIGPRSRFTLCQRLPRLVPAAPLRFAVISRHFARSRPFLCPSYRPSLCPSSRR